jgi:HK97 family phage major capsid protein
MLEVTKNNDNKVDELVALIKNIGDGNSEEFKSKFAELQEAVGKKHKEIDSQYGNLESKFEEKMSKMIENITNAFPNVDKQNSNLDKKYGKNMGEFLLNVKLRADEIKALGEVSGNTGGYLVPEEFSSEILRVELEGSVVRSNGARVINMNSSTIKIPALNMSSNAVGSMFGGVTAYWTEEGAQKTESAPKFKRVTLEPKKLCAYTESSDELVADSIVSMGDLLSTMFGEALAFEEDYAFLQGDGVGKPLGITVAPCYATVSRSSASIIVTADIVNMLSRFKGNMDRARWVVNQSALPYIYKLMDGNDNYIWSPGNSGSIASAAPGTLYGIPIIVSEKVPAVGSTGDLMLCDFGYYLIGDRQGLIVEESMHYKFQNDVKAWRCTKRVDGQPWLDSVITPRNGGSSVSPFLGIA